MRCQSTVSCCSLIALPLLTLAGCRAAALHLTEDRPNGVRHSRIFPRDTLHVRSRYIQVMLPVALALCLRLLLLQCPHCRVLLPTPLAPVPPEPAGAAPAARLHPPASASGCAGSRPASPLPARPPSRTRSAAPAGTRAPPSLASPHTVPA